MIQSFTIKNFKSFKEATLPLGPLTVLIGANASGKTNAIEAMRFLSWLSERGTGLQEVDIEQFLGHRRVRGRPQQWLRGKVKKFALACSLVGGGDAGSRLSFEFEISGENIEISKETLREQGHKRPLYVVSPLKKGAFLSLFGENLVTVRGVKQWGKSAWTLSKREPLLSLPESHYGLDIDGSQVARRIGRTLSRFRSALESALFLDVRPQRIREFEAGVAHKLSPDGANLVPVLQEVCEVNEEKEDVLRFIGTLPEFPVSDIQFGASQGNRPSLQLKEGGGPSASTFDLEMLSDGTLRVLAIAAALLSTEPGSMVVVEEIDNGIHPSRVRHLLEEILRVAKERNLRVLVTTHSPALLNVLPDEALPDVVCCYRDPDEGDSRLVRLSDLERYPNLMAKGPLGDLVTQGVVERFVKDKTTTEERAEAALSFLDTLKGTPDEGEEG